MSAGATTGRSSWLLAAAGRQVIVPAPGNSPPAAIAVAQSPTLAVERVWTQDAGGNTKTTFAPGDAIQIVSRLNNSYDRTPFSAALAITTTFYGPFLAPDNLPGAIPKPDRSRA